MPNMANAMFFCTPYKTEIPLHEKQAFSAENSSQPSISDKQVIH
jgi:hypothetical protein